MIESGHQTRVLVVDDSPELLTNVSRALRRHGYSVRGCLDATEARQAWALETPDIILLDLLLPDADGMDLCADIVETLDVPVIMLTARDSVADRVDGLRAGADDYLVKPFAMEELVARIEAVLRRRPASPSVLVYDDVELRRDERRVFRAGEEIQLTPKEFALLELLLRRPRGVVSRQLIADTLWPEDTGADNNLLDAHVANLRHKLERGGHRRVVQTVRSIGFVLR